MSKGKLQDLVHKESGLSVDSYSPGDGVTRYRFFTGGDEGYFSGRGVFTALGYKEAMTFSTGFVQGWYAAQKAKGENNV